MCTDLAPWAGAVAHAHASDMHIVIDAALIVSHSTYMMTYMILYNDNFAVARPQSVQCNPKPDRTGMK